MVKKETFRKIKELYDARVASKLDAVRAAGQWGPDATNVLEICEKIWEKIDVNSVDNILEIGCGTGVLGNFLNKRCKNYFGIDLSFLMLKKFQEYYEGIQLNIIQALADNIPFHENFFNVIIMNSITFHFEDKGLMEKVLQEIERIAKKNAVIFIGDNVTPSSTYWEYTWFQKLNPVFQIFAKPYIKFRIFLAKNNSKFAGKWSYYLREVDPKLIEKFFEGKGEVKSSCSATTEVKKKKIGTNWHGNSRVDFVIRLK